MEGAAQLRDWLAGQEVMLAVLILRAAEERRTANFLAQNDATPASIPMPPPPPNGVPPPIEVMPGWQPPPPKHPPPQEMMASVYWGIPPHEVDVEGGSRYGFRHVERSSRM